MTEHISRSEPIKAPEFEDGLELMDSENYTVAYGYRDSSSPTTEEQRIFIIPKNQTAEQILTTFCNRQTIPLNRASGGEYSRAVLRGDFAKIITQLKNQSHADVPSIANLETQILQVSMESGQSPDLPREKTKDVLSKKVTQMLAPLQEKAQQAKTSMAETKEALANLDPKEIAMSMLNEAQEKLVKKLKEFKVEIKPTLIAAAIVIMLVTSPIHHATITHISDVGEIAQTGGNILKTIEAYYEFVSDWENKAFYYLPMVSSVITALSMTLIGLSIKISKKNKDESTK